MGGGIPKPAQSSATVGDDSKGSRKDESNSAGPGGNVQIGGAISFNLWNRELGGDQGYSKGPDGVPTSGGVTDHGDDSKT